jgi:hypothetical protein
MCKSRSWDRPDVVAQLKTVEEGTLIEETESIDEIPIVEDPLEFVDVDVDLADGQCGDLEDLVRVARRDVARAAGLAPLEGEFVDPDRRWLAINALRAHHIRIQETLNCLSRFIR